VDLKAAALLPAGETLGPLLQVVAVEKGLVHGLLFFPAITQCD